MNHKTALVVLSCLAIVAAGLSWTGCPQKTWYLHGEQGQVTAEIALACQHGELTLVSRQAYSHQNPTWVRDIDLWPVYTRISNFDLHRQKLCAASDPMFIMTIANELGLWVLVLLFGTCPTVAFVRGPLRRYRRRQRGLCAVCGYDLSGNVSGRCPECGTAIKGVEG